jgi:hypothetical protein
MDMMRTHFDHYNSQVAPLFSALACISAAQTKAFGNAETDQLYAEETQLKIQEAQQRLQAIPGMMNPNLINDGMGDD